MAMPMEPAPMTPMFLLFFIVLIVLFLGGVGSPAYCQQSEGSDCVPPNRLVLEPRQVYVRRGRCGGAFSDKRWDLGERIRAGQC